MAPKLSKPTRCPSSSPEAPKRGSSDDAMVSECDEVVIKLKRVLQLGFGPQITKLSSESTDENDTRIFLDGGEPKPDGTYKWTPEEITKFIDFLDYMCQAHFEKLHVVRFRVALMLLDDDLQRQLSKSENYFWRFQWAKAESDRLSSLWQHVLRSIKRSGESNCNAIEVLKTIWSA